MGRMKTVTLHYREDLIHRAVLAFWLRATGWGFFTAAGLLLASFIALLAVGDHSWFVGVTGAVLGLAVVFAVALYVVHYRSSVTRFRRMKNPQAVLEMGEDSFRIASDVGSSEFAWSVITQVWRFPDFWLVFFSPAQFVTLPLADLDEEAREMLLEKVRAQGAKVR